MCFLAQKCLARLNSIFGLRMLFRRISVLLASQRAGLFFCKRSSMHTRIKLAVLLAVLSVTINSHAASGSARFALTHVSVVDVVRGTIIADQTVLIAGERIVSLGPSSQGKIPRGYSKIDGRSKFLMPGLWDMHVHLAGLIADPAWSKQLLVPLLISHGITGIRDMGGDLTVLKGWRAEIGA